MMKILKIMKELTLKGCLNIVLLIIIIVVLSGCANKIVELKQTKDVISVEGTKESKNTKMNEDVDSTVKEEVFRWMDS